MTQNGSSAQAERDLRDNYLCRAMLDALADLGDVEGAARLVDLMLEENQAGLTTI